MQLLISIWSSWKCVKAQGNIKTSMYLMLHDLIKMTVSYKLACALVSFCITLLAGICLTCPVCNVFAQDRNKACDIKNSTR